MMPDMPYTAYIVSATQNAYLEYTAGAETAVKCDFRRINEVTIGGNNQQIQSDAMAWFEPDVGIDQGTIIKFKGEHYRVIETIDGRDLEATGAPVIFIKTRLQKYGVIS